MLTTLSATRYMGDAHKATEYFSRIGFQCPKQHNPGDYFLDIISLDVRAWGGGRGPGARCTTDTRARPSLQPVVSPPTQTRNEERARETSKRIQYLAERRRDDEREHPLPPPTKVGSSAMMEAWPSPCCLLSEFCDSVASLLQKGMAMGLFLDASTFPLISQGIADSQREAFKNPEASSKYATSWLTQVCVCCLFNLD